MIRRLLCFFGLHDYRRKLTCYGTRLEIKSTVHFGAVILGKTICRHCGKIKKIEGEIR